MNSPEITTDTLFLACTRPAMWHGVPIQAVAINGMITTIIFVLMGNPFYLLLGIVLHHLCRWLVVYDHNMFRVLGVWLNTKGAAHNTAAWGGSSISPLPLRLARHPEEIRVHG